MSVIVSRLVWDGCFTKKNSGYTLVMAALADFSDDYGICFPSMATIANRVGLSRSNVQRIVRQLIADGWVTVIGNAAGGAPGSTCRFKLAINRMATGRMDATPTGSVDATGSAGATGSVDAADGSHGCVETGSVGATQTTIEPSITISTVEGAHASSSPAGGAAPGIPDCPHAKLIDLFGKRLPELPQPKPELWGGTRARDMRSRWRWVLMAKTSSGKPYAETPEQAIDFLDRFFGHVAKSDFLTGRNGKWAGCTLAWLMNEANFAKVMEGNFDNAEQAVAA